MTILLKQSTASQEIPLGYFLDSTDGNTEETALTIANTDIKLWKNGATTLANKNSGGGTHISNGIYYATLDATDTNTLGPMVIFVHVSGALAVRLECLVLAANVFDSLVSASDYLQTDAIQIEGSDATDQINAACDTAMTDYDAVVPADLPANFGDLSIAVTTGRVDVGSIEGSDATDQIRDAIVDDATRIDASALNTLSGLAPASTIAAATDVPTAAANADAVWDEAATGHTDAGKAGAQLWTDIDAILTDTAEIGAAGAGLTAVPWNAAWDAEVQSECTDALNAYDPPTKAELDTGFAALNDITAADVWDATSATLSLSFETITDRIYRFLMNKMNITDATGAVALRNEGDSGDLATQTITDNDTTTTRTSLSWA